MENHPANIFLAAVISLVVTSGLMMGVFFLDFVLCDRQCLVPEVDIEEAQRTIIELTDYDEEPCLHDDDACPHYDSHCAH